MEKHFDSVEGQTVLAFLKSRFDFKVVRMDRNFVHLKFENSCMDSDVIGFSEIVRRHHPHFFDKMDLCVLYEFPIKPKALAFCVYGESLLKNELSKEYGGWCVGCYWLLNNEENSYYGYKTEDLPVVQNVVKYVETFI